MSTATIADIARQAGVGTATVDRVLNKRPGVNAETVQRVMQVVAELGAPPLRGRPRKGENFRFAFVLPAEGAPFNELVDRQIAQAAGEFRHQHITEVTHRIEAADAALFAAGLAQLAECDAVAVMAPDLPPVKLAMSPMTPLCDWPPDGRIVAWAMYIRGVKKVRTTPATAPAPRSASSSPARATMAKPRPKSTRRIHVRAGGPAGEGWGASSIRPT